MAKKNKEPAQPLPPPPQEWESYKDEVAGLIDWSPANVGRPGTAGRDTESTKEEFIEVLCKICKEWASDASADAERIMKRVGISVQTYFKYCRLNPRYYDYLNDLKQSRMQRLFGKAIDFIDSVLEKPHEYDERTVLACIAIMMKHKVAREAGFAKETDIKTLTIVDKATPIPIYTKEEEDKAKI